MQPSHTSETPAAVSTPIPKLDIVGLWLILFVLGGGLLALYYAGIGYFPEVSWEGALTLMALMTIIGGSLLVAYSVLLFVPGAIWSEFLIFQRQLSQIFMMRGRGDEHEPCVLSVAERILFPFALFMAFGHCLLFLQNESPGVVAVGAAASLVAVSGLLGRNLGELLGRLARGETVAVPDPKTILWYRLRVAAFHSPLLVLFIAKALFGARPYPVILWIAACLPLASFAGYLRRPIRGWWRRQSRSEKAASPENGAVPDKESLLYRSILAFGSAAGLSLAALWFFHRIYKGKPLGTSGTGAEVPWQLLLLCTVVVIVTNLAVSVLFHRHRHAAFLASFLAALLLLGAGHLLGTAAEAKLPAKIMQGFGFGTSNVTLVLTDKGGRLLCQQSIPVDFENLPQPEAAGVGSGPTGDRGIQEAPLEASGKPAEGNQEQGYLARAAGASILSRLGSEYLLRFEDRTLTLPAGEVVSWSVRRTDNRPSVDNECRRRSELALTTTTR